jgi:hypothetical protein
MARRRGTLSNYWVFRIGSLPSLSIRRSGWRGRGRGRVR